VLACPLIFHPYQRQITVALQKRFASLLVAFRIFRHEILRAKEGCGMAAQAMAGALNKTSEMIPRRITDRISLE